MSLNDVLTKLYIQNYLLLFLYIIWEMNLLSIAVGTPHGNAKSNDRIFYCNRPSALKKIQNE